MIRSTRPTWEYLPLLAGLCFVPPALNIMLQTLIWSLGFSALKAGGVMALLGGLTILWLFFRRDFTRKDFVLVLLVFAILFVVSFAISSYYVESTRDGMAYHQEAILQLKDGWNPVRTKLPDGIENAIFINTYPKASWINSATIFAFTDHVDSGKVFNMLYAAGAFFLCVHLLRVLHASTWLSVAGALLLTLNSVMIVQFQSNMVDQINASISAALVASLLLFVIDNELGKYWCLLVCALLIVFNTKFTSLINAIMFLGFLGIGTLLFKRGDFKRVFLLCSTAILVFLLSGINPYFTNLADGKHLLHPVMGGEKVDVMQGMTPLNYVNNNPVASTFNSVFSVSANGTEPSELKFPGKISWNEFSVFSAYYDTRKGGFGPTFSLLLIISFVLFIATSAKNWRTELGVAAFIAGALLITVLANPAGWWARIVPQLWLVPCILLIAVVMCSAGTTRMFASIAIFAALMIQGFYFLSHLYYDNTTTRQIKRQLTEIRESKKSILVNFGHLPSVRERLREAGIPFEETSAPMPDSARQLIATKSQFVYQ